MTKKTRTEASAILETLRARTAERPVDDENEDIVTKLDRRGDLLVTTDELFSSSIVYVLGSHEEVVEVWKRLFENCGKLGRAHGWHLFGKIRGVNANANLIFVNTDWIPREQCLPSLAHEIVHFADSTLEHADVEDKNGEVRAALVEREFGRVLARLFGIKCYSHDADGKVRELLAKPLDPSISQTGN
jgi:hypothetical protein